MSLLPSAIGLTAVAVVALMACDRHREQGRAASVPF
jgi:hypothetical protein